jgi:hypothetical protein
MMPDISTFLIQLKISALAPRRPPPQKNIQRFIEISLKNLTYPCIYA